MQEQIEKLNRKLKKIRGNDPISKARREAILLALFELMQEANG